MLTDYEAVVKGLKVHLETKDSHGRRELHQVIGELEAKHQIKEGVTERALRVASNTISEQLLRSGHSPNGSAAAGVGTNGVVDPPVPEPH